MTNSTTLPWGIVDTSGSLLFDEDNRAHIYWTRQDARAALHFNDWSGFTYTPTVKRISWEAL